jgi:hypothetical protein
VILIDRMKKIFDMYRKMPRGQDKQVQREEYLLDNIDSRTFALDALDNTRYDLFVNLCYLVQDVAYCRYMASVTPEDKLRQVAQMMREEVQQPQELWPSKMASLERWYNLVEPFKPIKWSYFPSIFCNRIGTESDMLGHTAFDITINDTVAFIPPETEQITRMITLYTETFDYDESRVIKKSLTKYGDNIFSVLRLTLANYRWIDGQSIEVAFADENLRNYIFESAVKYFPDLLGARIAITTAIFIACNSHYLGERYIFDRDNAKKFYTSLNKLMKKKDAHVKFEQIMFYLNDPVQVENYRTSMIRPLDIQMSSIVDYFSMHNRPGNIVIQDSGDTGSGKTFKSSFFAQIFYANKNIAVFAPGATKTGWETALKMIESRKIGSKKNELTFGPEMIARESTTTGNALIVYDTIEHEMVRLDGTTETGLVRVNFRPTQEFISMIEEGIVVILDEFQNYLGSDPTAIYSHWATENKQRHDLNYLGIALLTLIDCVRKYDIHNHSRIIMLSATPGNQPSHPKKVMEFLGIVTGPDILKSNLSNIPQHIRDYVTPEEISTTVNNEVEWGAVSPLRVLRNLYVSFLMNWRILRGRDFDRLIRAESDEFLESFDDLYAEYNKIVEASTTTLQTPAIYAFYKLIVRPFYCTTSSSKTPLIPVNVRTTFTEEYREKIEAIRETMITDTESGEFKIRFNELTRTMKTIDAAKTPDKAMLINYILSKSTNHKIVIGVNYVKVIDLILKELQKLEESGECSIGQGKDLEDMGKKFGYRIPIRCGRNSTHIGVIHGTIPENKRLALFNEFQRPNSSLRVVIFTSETGGVGVNLHDTNGAWPRIGLQDVTYKYPMFHQFAGRMNRIGQKSESKVYILYSADPTFETNINRNLYQKDIVYFIMKKSVRDDSVNLFQEPELSQLVPISDIRPLE